MLNKIIIIGGGVVEKRKGKYYARSQLVEYFEEFRDYYSNVLWSVRITPSHNYRTIITHKNTFKLDIINQGGESFFSSKGLLAQIKHYANILKTLDKSTDIIVNGLSLTTFPYLILARLFGHRSLYYLGSDPKLTQELRKGTFYGRTLSLLNKIALPIILKCPNYVLVRGKSTLEQCQRWNKNTILSRPLISYKQLRKATTYEYRDLKSKFFNILYIGKLEKNKGVQVLLEALSIISPSKVAPFSLNIVGSGMMEKEFRGLTKSYNLMNHVHFHGFVDDADKLTTLFCTSNLFIVPTVYSEGFPRVIDEAMAYGLPVICSRLGGMADGLSEKEVSFVEPGSAEYLASAIGRIIHDAEYRKQLQQASKLRAETTLKRTAAEQHVMLLAN